MRKFGWGGTLVLMGLAVDAVAVPANAGFVLSLSGPSTVTPGQSFEVSANMTASNGAADMFDIFAATVAVSGPRPLSYTGYVFNPAEIATGGAEDNSHPKGAAGTGNLGPVDSTNGLYAVTPAIADVQLEGLTLSNPDGSSNPFVGSGNFATLRLQMPSGAQPGEVYNLTPGVEFFNLGFDEVSVQPGSGLRVSVVPEPATLLLLGLGGLAIVRRRFLSA